MTGRRRHENPGRRVPPHVGNADRKEHNHSNHSNHGGWHVIKPEIFPGRGSFPRSTASQAGPGSKHTQQNRSFNVILSRVLPAMSAETQRHKKNWTACCLAARSNRMLSSPGPKRVATSSSFFLGFPHFSLVRSAALLLSCAARKRSTARFRISAGQSRMRKWPDHQELHRFGLSEP